MIGRGRRSLRKNGRGRFGRFAVCAAVCAAIQIAMRVTSGDANPAAETGTIEGQVDVTTPARARAADRYVDVAGGQPREVPNVPGVAFIQGKLASEHQTRPSGALRIAQRGETFDPALLVVPVGAEVEFPNEDPFFHNVFSYSRPKRFDLGRYRSGESKRVLFDRPGYVKVLCEVHKWMRASILVVENPYYAVIGDEGRFRITDVPAGAQKLAIEFFDRRSQVTDVNVPTGGVAQVRVPF